MIGEAIESVQALILDAPPGTQKAWFGGVEAGVYAGNHLPHEHRFDNASQLVHLILGLR